MLYCIFARIARILPKKYVSILTITVNVVCYVELFFDILNCHSGWYLIPYYVITTLLCIYIILLYELALMKVIVQVVYFLVSYVLAFIKVSVFIIKKLYYSVSKIVLKTAFLLKTSILEASLCENTTIIWFLICFLATIILLLFIKRISLSTLKLYSLIVSFIPLIWSLYLVLLYDGSGATYQFMCTFAYLHLTFGIDSVGLTLIILTSAIFPICIVLMKTVRGIITILILEWLILGTLLILDLLGFYILFESSIILLFLLIVRQNNISHINYNKHSKNDYSTINAAYKIVLYTVSCSLIFLPIILYIYTFYGTTNILILTYLSHYHMDMNCNNWLLTQYIIGFGLFCVFAVKLPLIPLHIWLPEAHVAAPTAGSVLLAGILLKLGGIGLIRFLIPLCPLFVITIFPLIALLCIASFILSTLTTLRQIDLKKIVAYSSIAHMALVTLTILSLYEHSNIASTYMMIAHGIVSPGLFYLVGALYERNHTKFLPYIIGLGTYMPLFALLFLVFTLANLSFPLTPNFLAELLCLIALFSIHSIYAYIFCCTQVLGAIYGFWTYNRLIHGVSSFDGLHGFSPLNKKRNQNNIEHSNYIIDITRNELLIITPLIIGIFWLGIKPMF